MDQAFPQNSFFSLKELNSLRFYQGDIENYSGGIDEGYSELLGAKGAFQIMNMLLYPGINNEMSRIKKEHKKIPIQLLKKLPQIISIYEYIFSAMCKYRMLSAENKKLYLYRKDRMQSMEAIEKNCSYAWTSCSLKDEIEDSFQKKDGILLLEYEIPSSIPHIVMNEVLGENMYQSQEEVLLPPFLVFEKSVADFKEKELKYRDINGNPPKAKYLLNVKEINLEVRKESEDTKEEIEKFIFDEQEICVAINLLMKMYHDSELAEEDIARYFYWKGKIQELVKIKFKEIYNRYVENR